MTEEALLLAVEPTRTLIADFERRARGIESFNEHSFWGGNQSKLFLVLKWAHCGQRAEVMMEGWHSHTCDFREFLYAQRFRAIGPEPSDRFRGVPKACLKALPSGRDTCIASPESYIKSGVLKSARGVLGQIHKMATWSKDES